MAIRLLEWASGIFSKCLAQKILWGICLATLIPLVILFVYALKISRKDLKWRYLLMYSICLFECILLVIHYGFLPSDSEINDVSVLTQEFIKFIAYFAIFTMLIYDIIKLIRSKLIIGVTVTISLLLLAITGIIVKEYIDNSEYTCTSLTWTFLRICHVTMSIWLVVISTVVTQKTNIALKGADKMKRKKLWVI